MKSSILLTLAVVPSALVAAERPNILVYIADDHGFEQCEPYGDTYVKTPNLQRLANDGLTFDRAYVASPASGPDRSALLSGLMPARNGAMENHQQPRPETQTMVSRLQEQGYEVVAIGKVAHMPVYAEMCGFDQAFFKGVDKQNLTKAVKKYLSQRKSDKPLCLLVGDRRPHVSWIADMDYDPATLPLPDNLVDTRETREHYSRYLTDITGMDKTLGEVESEFESYVGNDDFLFIYTADHGAQWPFGKWNLYERGARVPLIVRWNGKVAPNERRGAMVQWIDIFPTLIDIAGGKAPKGIDGESFAKVLQSPTSSHRSHIFTTHNADELMNLYPIRSVRNERFKYIRNLWPDCQHSNHSDIKRKDGAGAYWDSWDEAAKVDPKAAAIVDHYFVRPAEELYDLENDPFEQHNLANDPRYQKELAKLSKMLDKWMASQGDVESTLPQSSYPIEGGRPRDVYEASLVNN